MCISDWSAGVCSSDLMSLSKTDNVDDYGDRMNACRIPVQIQLDNIFVSLGYAAEMPLVGYRKSHWGDSMSDVVATEGKPLVTKDGTLGYRVKQDGHEAFAAYTFIQGMRVKGSYIFTEEHSNNNAFVDDYNASSANLTVK